MTRKMIARSMILILLVNLMLCLPLKVSAEEFDADPVSVDNEKQTVTITETATDITTDDAEGTEGGADGGATTDAAEQTVSVEIPLDAALSQVPSDNSAPIVTDATSDPSIKYDTTVPASGDTVPVEEAFDLTAAIVEQETDADGNLTDITYEVSLDQRTTFGDEASEITADVDQQWQQSSNPPQIKVELSINGMENPTRVEHTFDDGTKEYFYNEANGSSDTSKKYFTVKEVSKTVTDAVANVVEAVTSKVVSLWTNMLGVFHITSDPFENQKDMTTSDNLADAVNNAENGSTVEMLRDYTTDKDAVLYNSGSKGDNVTVDFNQNTYEFTGSSVAVQVAGSGQTVQLQNGTIDSNGNGMYIWYDDNTLTLDHTAIDADGYYGILICPDSEDNSCNATVNMQNNSSVNSAWCGVYMEGNSNTLNAAESSISGTDYGIIVYDTGSEVILSDSNVSGGSVGIYSSGVGQSVGVKNNSSITTSGSGIYVWGDHSSYAIEDSTINYGSYGVELYQNGNTLNVKNSTIGASDLPGKWGIAAFGSDQNVNLFRSTVNASQMCFYATGGNHVFTAAEGSTLNSNIYGVDFQNAPGSTLFFKDSVINAGSYGLYAGAYSKTSDGGYIPLLGNYNLTFKNSVINGAAQGLEVFGNQNTIDMSGTTINTDNVGILDGGKQNTYTVTDSSIFFDRGDNSEYSYGITHNGSNGGARFTLTNTTIDPGQNGAIGIYISGSTTTAAADADGLNELILKGVTVAGYRSAVEVKFTDVTVDLSTFVSHSSEGLYIPNSNGTTTSGAALAVTDNTDGKTGGTMLINSGKFYGHEDIDNIYQVVKETTGDDKANIIILGGRYVHTGGLYQFIPEGYAAISHNDGSEYPYEVVAEGFVPARSGYVFMGYQDINGSDITLEEAFAEKIVAYAQWKLAPQLAAQAPKAEEDDNSDAIIIVQPDSKDNNVDVTIQDAAALITVSTPAGDVDAISEVTITSVERLREQGVETITVQVEENVTLELDVSKDADNGLEDAIVITREEDTLVISSGVETQITIHMAELRSVSEEPVHIRYHEGVITVSFGSTVVFRMEILEALKNNKNLTVILEGNLLKLYDKDHNLIQEIPM